MGWLSTVLSLLSAGCAARGACLWLRASLIDPLDDPLLAPPSAQLIVAPEPMSCRGALRLFLTRALRRLRLRGRSDEPKATEPADRQFGEGPTSDSWSLATLAAVRKSGPLNAKAAGWAAGSALLSVAAVLATLCAK
jgi:hypothetical protein